MANKTEWPRAFEILEDNKLYTLPSLLHIVRDEGYKIDRNKLYMWIYRRKLKKRGRLTEEESGQDFAVWLGADLKRAASLATSLD